MSTETDQAQYDRSVLAPFATNPLRDAIDDELEFRVYVRQLEFVGADLDDKIRAVTDYLKSVVDRTTWTERGDIHASSMDDLEAHLEAQWKAKKRRIDIERPELSEVDRGRLLQLECSTYQAKFQQMEPPLYFTWGSFQVLSDGRGIGWHPRFGYLLDDQEDGE